MCDCMQMHTRTRMHTRMHTRMRMHNVCMRCFRDSVAESHLTNLDGNGVFLSGYNRNATLAANEVSWIGDSAFAAWGATGTCLNGNCSRALRHKVGPDGRAGEQPRFTNVTGNLVHELGIYQKQSSFWFQAVTVQTHLAVRAPHGWTARHHM